MAEEPVQQGDLFELGQGVQKKKPGGTAPSEVLVDLHSHLVPGVDDGAADIERGLGALRSMAKAGVGRLVTTPHIDASLVGRDEVFERRHATVVDAWSGVEAAWDGAVELALAYEVLLDIPRPNLRDPRVHLGAGRYALVEFHRVVLPPHSEDVLYRIRSQDVTPIVAHVERYPFRDHPAPLWDEWRDAGAVLQVNTGSLVGRYGSVAQELAWECLERGWVGLLASDYHARGEPQIRSAIEALEVRSGEEQVDLLYRVNPARVLAGEPLLAVPPLPPEEEKGGLGKWLDRLRGE